jgi:polyhydroxyalkanoate synthesis regulator phasin
MKRSRTFQSSATDDALAIQKVVALIKAFTPATLMLGALEGGLLFYNRHDFQDCDSLVKELVTFDPYIKKSTLEAGLVIIDNEHRKQLSKAATSQGTWARQEGFALKEQVMKSIKKAHNSTRWNRPRNMDTVVQALLEKKGRQSLASPDPEASTPTGTWIEKHKRLLRRRSSDTDVICVKGPPAVPGQPGPDRQDNRKNIFAF